MEIKYRLLKPSEIDVRIGTVGAKGVTLLLYKDARVDMNILDETHGSELWQRDHKEVKGNMYAGVGIWNDVINQWVWKWDCGTESNTEKEKGEASDSFKRACVNLGIGRELYTSPFVFVRCETEQKDGRKYVLKNAFEFSGCKVESIAYNEEREISALSIANKQGTIIFSTGNVPTKRADKKADEPDFAEMAESQITKSQANVLKTLIKQFGVDEKKLCDFYKVATVEAMNNEQYSTALADLKKKYSKDK